MEKHGGSQVGTQVKGDDTEMIQVGFEFKPGTQGNIDIDRLLGHVAEEFNGQAHRKISDDPRTLNWVVTPDYCRDDSITIEMMDEMGITAFVMQNIKVSTPKKATKKVERNYIAIFDLKNKLYGTVPFETQEHAAACALWFILSISHK